MYEITAKGYAEAHHRVTELLTDVPSTCHLLTGHLVRTLQHVQLDLEQPHLCIAPTLPADVGRLFFSCSNLLHACMGATPIESLAAQQYAKLTVPFIKVLLSSATKWEQETLACCALGTGEHTDGLFAYGDGYSVNLMYKKHCGELVPCINAYIQSTYLKDLQVIVPFLAVYSEYLADKFAVLNGDDAVEDVHLRLTIGEVRYCGGTNSTPLQEVYPCPQGYVPLDRFIPRVLLHDLWMCGAFDADDIRNGASDFDRLITDRLLE